MSLSGSSRLSLVPCPGQPRAADAGVGKFLPAAPPGRHGADWRGGGAEERRRRGRRRKAVLVGANANAARLIGTGRLDVIAVFDDRAGGRAPASLGGVPVIGRVDDMPGWARLCEADCIIITVPSRAVERVGAVAARLLGLPNSLAVYRDEAFHHPAATDAAAEDGTPLAYISRTPGSRSKEALKRTQDVVLGGLALVAAAPLMAVIAVLIKRDSRGPVLFRQKRHGLNNRVIEVLKFRTMRQDETGRPTMQVQAGDPRVTRIGRFLRKTSLDELPQLFNVLKGEMSLVGPRPHAIDMRTGGVESHLLAADYFHRHRVKPGMTGWAQINGSRGPVHTPELVRERVAYDLAYIQRQSLWMDLYILLMTLPCLLGDNLADR